MLCEMYELGHGSPFIGLEFRVMPLERTRLDQSRWIDIGVLLEGFLDLQEGFEQGFRVHVLLGGLDSEM